ncbi:MAG: hypothetical protein ACO23K_03315 [Ilumatobacteraceae bacterium]
MALTPGFYAGISSSGSNNLSSIATQYGATAPTNPTFGQMWVDTTNPNALVSYVWMEPGNWSKISDGTTNTFVDLSEPTGDLEAGDTWYNSGTNTFSVYDGTAWRAVGDAAAGQSTSVISYTFEPAVGPEGALYYNTTNNRFYVSNGTTWNRIAEGQYANSNSIVSLSAPATRPDGDALQVGDNWIDIGSNAFNFWNGSAWVRISSATAGDSHSFYLPDPPTTRPDNTPLVSGDIWIDSDNGFAYTWAGTVWSPINSSGYTDTNSILADTAPTVRVNGFSLEMGDIWVDSTNGSTYYWDGAAWVGIHALAPDSHSFASPVAPAIRPNGDPIEDGDQWVDIVTGRLYYYYSAAWHPTADTHAFYDNGVPALVTRPNGGLLEPGDRYIDGDDGTEYYFSGGSWLPVVSTEIHAMLPDGDIDVRSGDYFTLSMTGDTTLTFTNPASLPKVSKITLILNTNGFNVTWPAGVKWANSTPPVLSGGEDVLEFFSVDAGTTWYGTFKSYNAG